MVNTKSIELKSASSQYLSIAHADQTNLDLGDDFSVSFWFKFTTGDSGYIRLFDKFNANYGWFIYYSYNSGSPFFALRVGNGSGSGGHSCSVSGIEDGTWYHIQLSWDESARRLYGWKNGVAMGNDPNAGQAEYLVAGSVDLKIGTFDGTTQANMFNGLMDEICIWNDFRTEAEAEAEYNDGDGVERVGNEAGLVACWRFENNLLDLTSNDNDLTNNNSATFSSDVPFPEPVDFIPKILII